MTESYLRDITSLIRDLGSATPSVRARAAEALGWYASRPPRGGPEVIDALVAASRDPEVFVRRASVRSLMRYKRDDRAIHALIQWVVCEETDGVADLYQRDLFDKLVEEMNPPVAPQFVKLLGAYNERTRWRAAVWLARRGDAAAADTLGAFLNSHENVPRREAGLVLENLGIPVASNCDPETLMEAVLTDGGSIRVAAAWALGLIGDSRALHILLPLVTLGHDAGSIVPVLELILTRDAAHATEADLRAAATLTAPHQFRDYGDNSQFGPGPGRIELEPLNLDLVHQLATTELARRDV